MSLTLKSCCPVCNATEKLSRCKACQVMLYCGRGHQVTHRNEHKKACNVIKTSKERLDFEEDKLRNTTPDMFTPPNLFEECVGRFWGILETRDYMRARFGYVDALLKIKTACAVQTAFDNVWDMLRLCRGDNLGMRDLIPGLFLRLGRDQECYDFIKWHADPRPNYDWGDMSLPYLDVKDADVFEPVDMFIGRWFDVCHAVAITLIKIRLLLELKNLQNSQIVGKKVPQEILDNVQNQILSDVISRNPRRKDIMERKEALDQVVSDLKSQIFELHEAVGRENGHFWPALLDPDDHLKARMEAYSRGSVEEMQLFLQYSYNSWAETPGAIEIVDQLENDEFLEDDDE